MITREQARAIALQKVQTFSSEIELVLLDDQTIEQDFGWVFIYDSKKHLETANFQDAIAGNAPLIVDRLDGSVHITGTAKSLDYYLAQYRQQRQTK